MFMHIHSRGHCDIRLSKTDQKQVLAAGKARPHRQAPQAGYVTFIVDEERRFRGRNGSDLDVTSFNLPANRVFCEPNTNDRRATFFSLFRNEKILDFSLHNGQICCTDNSPFSP